MAQYHKDVFNLAKGPGQAIVDPREAEARALEESRRQDQALAWQQQQSSFENMLNQQNQNLQAESMGMQQAMEQARMQQQGSQFDQELQARLNAQDLDRQLQSRGMDQSAFENEQGRLQQNALAQQGFGLQREGMQQDMSKFNASLQDNAAGRQFQGNQAMLDRGFQGGQNDLNRGLQSRGLDLQKSGQDFGQGMAQAQFGLQQGGQQFDQNMAIQNLNMQNRQFMQADQAAAAQRYQQGAAWLKENAPDVLLGNQSAFTSKMQNKLALEDPQTLRGVQEVLKNPAMKGLAGDYFSHGVQGFLRSNAPIDTEGNVSGTSDQIFTSPQDIAALLGVSTQQEKNSGNLSRLQRRVAQGDALLPPNQSAMLPQINTAVLQALASQQSQVPMGQNPIRQAAANPFNPQTQMASWAYWQAMNGGFIPGSPTAQLQEAPAPQDFNWRKPTVVKGFPR